MTQTGTENINKNTENESRGRRVSKKIRNRIIEAFLDLVREGKTGRELSASNIERRISEHYPDELNSLPTWQSINNIVKKHRDSLSQNTVYDRDWSMSLWMKEPAGITREDLPLVMNIQRHMSMDIERRSAMNFRDNRLSVREARWVGPINTILISQNPHWKDNEYTLLSNLVSMIKRCALREKAIEMTDDSTDTYDIDMELAFNDPSETRGPSQQLALYTEMGLVPDRPKPTENWDIDQLEYDIDQESDDQEINNEDIPDGKSLPVKEIFERMLRRKISIKVEFSTADWDEDHWSHSPDWPNQPPPTGPSRESIIEYDVNEELMKPLRPLIKWDGDVQDSDPQPVKVATAFWNKVQKKVRELAQDPKIKRKLGHTIRKFDLTGQGGMMMNTYVDPNPLIPEDEE